MTLPWLSTKRSATAPDRSACSRASSLAYSAWPSPWAMAIGRREPAMPCRKIDADSCTWTMATRASNCSERLRTKRGQASLPGISSPRLESIWQPLHTPRAKLSLRSKKALKLSRARLLNSTDLAQPPPAPSTSP
ncbi:hypothetical protein D3C80_1726550 [compost metagenome]